MGTVATTFDRKANGLNFLRLCLAAGVIVWHSFRLTGHDIGWHPLRQVVSSFSVDGFFAISGFLIAGSWLARPKIGSFLRARALRILPGFYVCLLITALVLAPIMVTVTGGHLHLADELAYIRANGLLWVTRYDIAGTPVGVPYPHVWNGSTWTLGWEAICYLGVVALGVVGLLRRRWVTTGLFAAATAVSIGIAADVDLPGLILAGGRFAIMFLAGVVIKSWADRIPVSRWIVIGATAVACLATLLPDYRILAALPIAYLLIVAGSAIRSSRLRFRNDISYGVYVYAFPVQQSLAMVGLWHVGVPLFAVASTLLTLPFAAASWFWVERNALKLKGSTPTPRTSSETNRSDASATPISL